MELRQYIWPGDRIADLGCGSGQDARSFVEWSASVVAVDSDLLAVERVNLWARNLVESGHKDTFKFIHMNGLLQWLPTDQARSLCADLSILLKPRGYVYIRTFTHAPVPNLPEANFPRSMEEVESMFPGFATLESEHESDSRVVRSVGTKVVFRYCEILLRKSSH